MIPDDLRPHDRDIYEQEIAPWLPARIYDCHVHVGLEQHCGPVSPERIKANWAMEVGSAQSWEILQRRHRLLFPDREVCTLAFGGVFREIDLEANNAYVLAGARDPANRACGLMVTAPEWPATRIEEGLAQGFRGVKPYPDLAPMGSERARIADFLPDHHVEVLNRHRGVLMLHLPRPGRLADPANLEDLTALADRYPGIRLIVAHVGRAFCLPTARKGLAPFVSRPNVHWDIAAHLNADVFRLVLETMGPDRLLYGSDLPITIMRGEREHRGEMYINYTDAPYSWNTNRKPPEVEARYTFFLYQELRALVQAVQACGMGRKEMAQIMFGNCARLVGSPPSPPGAGGFSPSAPGRGLG